jgi:murein DD-endopeptidase MepM/ murein hydrolase activator NlpD
VTAAALRLACVALALLLAAQGGELRAAMESPAPSHHYRLPWPEGVSYMFVQAPGARANPHFLRSNLHAVDIGIPEGAAVLAAREGVVEAMEDGQGSGLDEDPATYDGNFVRVRHADDTYATYAHLKRQGVLVRAGESVHAGQLLGYSGASGDVVKPHLHFGVSRFEQNKAGRWEEVSLPITFTVGVPAHAFQARAGLMATPNYHGPAERPRYPSEPRRMFEPAGRALTPEEELKGWLQLLAFLAFGVAGMIISWRWSRG